jgi:hypothetical protein
MASRILASLFAGLLGSLVLGAPAWAEGTLFPGARPLGIGGALRAVATGDSGPMLNPSGISLIRSYSLEAGYQFSKNPDSHDMRVSAVDSTSGFNLGGALYYTYHRASVGSDLSETGHIGGGSLSFPLLEKLYLGANIKYVRFKDVVGDSHSGFTFDAGLTVRPLPQISFAAVAYNIREVAQAWTPKGAGGGVAFLPIPIILLSFDAVWTKVYGDPDRTQAWQFMGGGEFTLGSSAFLRAGGGRDGLSTSSYLTAGLTMLSMQLGAVDIGFRQDISGDTKSTLVGVSMRLFVPGV